MGRANRNFGDDPEFRGYPLHGFDPGGEDFGVVRQVDSSVPYDTGLDASNVHQPSAGDPQWDDPIGVTVEDD